ncbi:MAG TPA: hypothetical protein VNI20_13140, partial [Fimbriimonadaceae bacterium]|nr:hypothetical protein [Fimbriimonadaceae bacterium]
NGAKNEGTFVLERAVTRGSAVATHHYLLDEPFEVAVKEVGAELMAEGDWVAVGSIPGRYENTRTNKHIEVMRPQWVNSKADPGKAVVWVTEPATIFDRLIAWMHKRYFRVPRSYPPGTSATQLT